MVSGRPSRTALGAAHHRAAHQILEQGRIFSDPLAVRILAEDAEAIARRAEENPAGRRMRIFIAVRTRFAEDALGAAVEKGVRQLVVLGAGLDTFAYRSPFGDRLRVFEVDHPATQAWKRELLAAAGIPMPSWLTFVPVDFESQRLEHCLASAGFDPARPTFFTWLGVVPYLTEEAVWATLRFIGGLPGGAHVVFDYGDPPEMLPPETRELHDGLASRVAELGERLLTWFEPARLRERLLEAGFSEVEDLGPRQFAARYFPQRAAAVSERGGHVVRASR
jgi:methyltransferase (TIGR00027 family)